MVYRKIKKNFVFALLFAFASCANLPYPKEKIVRVENNKIYLDNELYAELRYLNDEISGNRYYRGAAIYYYPQKSEKWIFPLKGWVLKEDNTFYNNFSDIKRLWAKDKYSSLLINGRNITKGEFFIYGFCYDINISKDGKYILYKTPGILFDSNHKYIVEYKN